MDYVKYVIVFFWCGPIAFLIAAVLRYIDKNVITPYIVDIIAAVCFSIGLTTEFICEFLAKKPLYIAHYIMHIAYTIAPVGYFIASICRVVRISQGYNAATLSINIIDIIATLSFLTGTTMRLVLEVRAKRSNAHILVIGIYWIAHLLFVSSFIYYTIDSTTKNPHMIEIASGCCFSIAATLWLIGELLIRWCNLVIIREENIDDETD